MSITKKTRALAIEGLELAANNYVGHPAGGGFRNIDLWLDETPPAHNLAQAAALAAPGIGQSMLLEAAALLRDGWSPGEEIEIGAL